MKCPPSRDEVVGYLYSWWLCVMVVLGDRWFGLLGTHWGGWLVSFVIFLVLWGFWGLIRWLFSHYICVGAGLLRLWMRRAYDGVGVWQGVCSFVWRIRVGNEGIVRLQSLVPCGIMDLCWWGMLGHDWIWICWYWGQGLDPLELGLSARSAVGVLGVMALFLRFCVTALM